MRKSSLALAIAASTLSLSFSHVAHAGFIDDSKASVEARNFYFNRDFRDGGTATSQAKSEEWAQGFLLRLESGFTDGTIGFGIDALATAGFKLDSGGGTAGSGLLVPDGSSGGSQDNYGGLGLTAKAKVSESVLKVGTLQLKNQAVGSSDSRLLPQVFRGGQIVSKEIAGLTLDGGYLEQVNNRNSSDYQDMRLNTFANSGITVSGANRANQFIFAGGNYKLTDSLTGGYYYSNLEDLYKQHSFNLVHVLPIADNQSLKSDLRYARSTDDGSSNVDNKAFGAMFTYALSGHSLGLGYQKMSGDTGFAYIGDSVDPFLVNYVQIGNFAAKDESSWQARYDFNFASIGVPGLTFMTRYLNGDNIDRGAAADGKEWERDMDIAYVVQDGTFKNLGVKWRNATMRNNFSRDIDENRLIVSYTLPLL
ncbi:MAG: OprD family porin [Pseudomonas sp.]